ncbi:MAG: tRNA 4-thiouridine(8) synthase ThiI [Lachnospiraceae bacterium]|nr:tRNA 4-thiouridine(8) synthase ThiI [Lachnospiraceae bacterium]
MEFKSFLIKYAEIGIKGKNRFLFEDALVKQMRHALRNCEGDMKVYKQPGRIYAETETHCDYDEVVAALKRVFGISAICPVVQLEDEGFEKLGRDVTDYIREVYGADCDKTFKVNARRARKDYPKTSQEINEDLGEILLDAFPGMRVDVHKPDILLNVEVRERFICVYSIVIPGPGGMPVGTNGKAMLLLSGGIDSPVAGYMIAKRGCKIDATYFHAPPYTSDLARQKVIDLARIVSRYSGPVVLNIVNFTDIQMAIYEKCPHEELTIIMRRYMMRIAQDLALKNDCLGLITGESIGQVASQTMQSMLVTNEVCDIPVYRPCVGLDKQEIVDISEKIGAYETSILPYEDCCTIYVAKHPVTKPTLKHIKKSEALLSDVIDDLYKQAIDTVETMWVK